MPRTKNVRKPRQELQISTECDLLMRDFDRQAQLRIMKLEAEAKSEIQSLETFVDLTLPRLPIEVQQMTVCELFNIMTEDEKENSKEVSSTVDDRILSPKTVKLKKATGKRITSTSDDGYVTEGIRSTRTFGTTVTGHLTTTIRTRSSSRNTRVKLSEVNEGTVKKTKNEHSTASKKFDKFKTPARALNLKNEFDLVTPKMKPNTPLNILRRPRQGEMALSMQGSPLLVSAVAQDETANINVPLSDGNIISLLPNEGLRMSHIPDLDPETKRQLMTLKSHIEKVISKK